MNLAEKVFEEVRTLPEFEMREVLDFVGFLKTKQNQQPRQNIAAVKPAAAATEEETDWAEFEKGAGIWSGKFVREDCYDRKIFR